MDEVIQAAQETSDNGEGRVGRRWCQSPSSQPGPDVSHSDQLGSRGLSQSLGPGLQARVGAKWAQATSA